MSTTSLPTLRDLGNARDILDSFLLEYEGEETPEIADLWAQLEGETAEKIERWALWIVDRSGKAKEIKDEETRLAARRRAIENACERSKAELKRQMERIGKDKLNGVLCSVAIQKSPPAVTTALTDAGLAAAYNDTDGPGSVGQFVREIPVSYTLDRSAVLLAHKLGEPIPIEIQVTQNTHLRIR